MMARFCGLSSPRLALALIGGCITHASAFSSRVLSQAPATMTTKDPMSWAPQANEFTEMEGLYHAIEASIRNNMTGMEALQEKLFVEKLKTSKEIASKVAAGQSTVPQSSGYGTILAVASEPKGLAMCVPQASDMPWKKLLLRMHGQEPWNDMHDRIVRASVAKNLSAVTAENMSDFFQQAGDQYVKGVVVRDPVTRLLFGYLETCRSEGQWTECMSHHGRPVTFAEMVEKLDDMGTETAPEILRKQIDACGVQTQQFDVLGWHEDIEFSAQALLSEVGLWSDYGPQGWGEQGDAKFSDIFPIDNTHDKVCDFYSPKLLKIVQRLYSDDFEHFGYDVNTWKDRCANQWAAAGENETEANPHRIPTPGKYKFPLYHHATKCTPTSEELYTMARGEPTDFERSSNLKFYIHEDGDFDFSKVLDCFFDQYGLDASGDDWDDHVMANITEHLGEIWLLKALQSHPQRTMDKTEADVHVIGALPFISYMNTQGSPAGKTCGTFEDHEQRMDRVAKGLRKLDVFQNTNGRNFFIFTTHFRLPELYTDPLLAVLNEGNVMVGTADIDYTHWKMYPNIRRQVILPYKAHYLVEKGAFEDDRQGKRDIDFIFRGKIGRSNEGSARQAMWGLMNVSGLNLDIVDVKFANEDPSFSDELAIKYGNTRYCLAPAGDSPTSRRLFDALAGGCVPLALGDYDKLFRNLPFTRTIDYSKIVLYAGSLPCIDSDMEDAKSWLEVVAGGGQMESSMRMAGVEAFQGAMAYARNGTGMVSALMTELAHML